MFYPTEQSVDSMQQWFSISCQKEQELREHQQFESANDFESSRAHDLAIVSRRQAQTLIPLVASRYLAAPPGTPSEIKAAFEAIAEALVDASEIRRNPSAIEPSFREMARVFGDASHKAEAAYALATIPLQACLDSGDEKCPHEIALDTLRDLNFRVGHVMLRTILFELADFHVRSMPAFDVNELLGTMRRQVCKAAMHAGERTKPDNGNPVDQTTSHSPDFTSVVWFGTSYLFTKGQQAEAIRLLWTAWESSTPTISQKTIDEQAGSSSDDFKLSKLFRVTNADGKKTPSSLRKHDPICWKGSFPASRAGKALNEARTSSIPEFPPIFPISVPTSSPPHSAYWRHGHATLHADDAGPTVSPFRPQQGMASNRGRCWTHPVLQSRKEDLVQPRGR